jgi:hypothetical protein
VSPRESALPMLLRGTGATASDVLACFDVQCPIKLDVRLDRMYIGTLLGVMLLCQC